MAGGRRSSWSGAQVLILRGQGRSSLTVPVSPLRLVIGFIGLGLCPAFCLGLSAGQMGVAASELGAPQVLRASSLLQGLYAAQVRVPYQVFGRSRPNPSPPTPVPAVAAIPPVEEELLGEMQFQTPEERRGILRVQSLHFSERISVRPFDQEGRPNPEAFAAISHLWRCRITNHESPINERLIQLLTTLNDLYDRPVHLISGHRVPETLGTSDTSQHAEGTAADIRIPGVSIEELRAVVTELGARGVGLYNHKGFVHVDFRAKPRYFWVYPAVPDEGEGDDDRLATTGTTDSQTRSL